MLGFGVLPVLMQGRGKQKNNGQAPVTDPAVLYCMHVNSGSNLLWFILYKSALFSCTTLNIGQAMA